MAGQIFKTLMSKVLYRCISKKKTVSDLVVNHTGEFPVVVDGVLGNKLHHNGQGCVRSNHSGGLLQFKHTLIAIQHKLKKKYEL